MAGHVGTGGLQSHSIGELYPWTIRGYGESLQAFNCITGEQGVRHEYGKEVSFESAYNKAKADCIRLDVKKAA
jgi:hypothetical protein